MGVRNCREIGDNLQTIISRLMSNRTLIKLLYYTDKMPLEHDFDEIITRPAKHSGEKIWDIQQNKFVILTEDEIGNCIWDDQQKKFVDQENGTHVRKKYDFYANFCQGEIFEKLIKIVPRVGPKETANSILALEVVYGHRNSENGEFRNVKIIVESFVPLTQWLINSDNLRPFAILGEVQESLSGKTINGLGKLDGGDFDVNFLTDEISCYEQEFNLIAYE